MVKRVGEIIIKKKRAKNIEIKVLSDKATVALKGEHVFPKKLNMKGMGEFSVRWGTRHLKIV